MDPKIAEELLQIDDCYKSDTRHFIRFLSDRGLEIDFPGLEAYMRFLKDAGYAAETVNKRLQAAKNRLRLVFRKTEASMDVLGRYEMDRALKEIKGVKKNTKAVDTDKTLSLPEVRLLIDSEGIPERIRMFIRFLVSTGTRVSEATGIRLKDVKPEHGFVSIRIVGKGSKERYLKVPPKLIEQLHTVFHGAAYLFETKDGKIYSRQYVSDSIRLAGRAVLGRKISAHTLRHTFATIQIRKNRKVKALSTYLGHSSTSITQDMYVHEELDLEDLDLGI